MELLNSYLIVLDASGPSVKVECSGAPIPAAELWSFARDLQTHFSTPNDPSVYGAELAEVIEPT